MRIIAGSARGRRLTPPRRDDIRPTSDRAKETLFSVIGPWIEGEVLDLFAGTGALGLEAVSRGASRAVLVDVAREALELCRKNVEALGFEAQVEVLPSPALKAIEKLSASGRRFSHVFADPPYPLLATQGLLEALAGHPLLTPGGLLVLESDRREEEARHPAFERFDERAFGDTRIRLYRAVGAP